MMPVFIQFTGPQSSGKTTIADILEKKTIVPYSHIDEVPRELLKDSVISSLDIKASAVEQIIIQQEFLLERYRVLGERNPLIISCRSPLDVCAYAKYLNDDAALKNYAIESAIKYIQYSINRKDVRMITFFVESLDTFEEDGVRYKESKRDIEKEIRRLITIYNVPYTVLKAGTVSERLHTVQKTLEMLGLDNKLFGDLTL